MNGCTGKTPARAITSEFVSRLEKQNADPKELLESILGRRVATKNLLPSSIQKSNLSWTKSVRFSLNNEANQELGALNQRQPCSGKQTEGRSSTGKESERLTFGQDFMLMKLQQLIDNDRHRDFGNDKGMAKASRPNFKQTEDGSPFDMRDMVDKRMLRSKTDNKLVACDEALIADIARIKARSAVDRRQGRRFSDQLRMSKTRIEFNKIILESYLDKRAFSDNESDSDKVLSAVQAKKRKEIQKPQPAVIRQATVQSKAKATSDASTNCGTNQRTISKEKVQKKKVLPISEKSKVEALISRPMLIPPLSKPDDDLDNDQDRHEGSHLYREDIKEQGDNGEKKDARNLMSKDNFKSCLKKNGKYGVYDKVLKASDSNSSIIKPQVCPPESEPEVVVASKPRPKLGSLRLPTIREADCEQSPMPSTSLVPPEVSEAVSTDQKAPGDSSKKVHDQSKCCVLI